jgi:hypothetical protein
MQQSCFHHFFEILVYQIYKMEIDYEQRKLIKARFKILIETRNRTELDALLANETTVALLRSERHFDPFVIAIKSGQIDLIAYLIEKGFKLNCNEAKTDLAPSLKKRKLEDISAETETEEDMESDHTVTLSDQAGYSNAELSRNSENAGGACYSNPLIEAIKCGNYECVKMLIDLNVSLNSNNYKHVPLQIAYNLYSQERDRFLLFQSLPNQSISLKLEVTNF